MSLRELVTGSDACTPSESGAGPSNALSSFTNTFLGRGTKTQEQLREVTCTCQTLVLAGAMPASFRSVHIRRRNSVLLTAATVTACVSLHRSRT